MSATAEEGKKVRRLLMRSEDERSKRPVGGGGGGADSGQNNFLAFLLWLSLFGSAAVAAAEIDGENGGTWQITA
mgnify:CR=1 FL=1